MIAAKHQGWAHALFRPYLRSLIQRRFHALHLLGEIPAIPENTPILLLPNHATWWDGFFPYILNDLIWQREYFIMMLEHRLKEFWFFRFLGAFSINQQSPKGILETLDYTVQLLAAKRLIVMFPQGELSVWGKRPLGYNRGVERILKKCHDQGKRLAVLPLAMRCEFLGDEKPHIFLLFGKPLDVIESVPSATTLETIEHHLLEDLQNRIMTGETGNTLFPVSHHSK